MRETESSLLLIKDLMREKGKGKDRVSAWSESKRPWWQRAAVIATMGATVGLALLTCIV